MALPMTFELSEYSAHGEDFDVYLARPQGPGPHPVVLVCHAWGGRDEFAEDKARRLAELG